MIIDDVSLLVDHLKGELSGPHTPIYESFLKFSVGEVDYTYQTKNRKVALDILLDTTYAVALTSAEDATKPESAGLLAHMYLQHTATGNGSGGSQGLQCNKVFREWAAVKELKSMGRS